MWHHKGDPQLFPDSARDVLEDRPGTGGAVSSVTAAGVGVMISRTPRITVRDREVGRDEVSRRARDEPGSVARRAHLISNAEAVIVRKRTEAVRKPYGSVRKPYGSVRKPWYGLGSINADQGGSANADQSKR